MRETRSGPHPAFGRSAPSIAPESVDAPNTSSRDLVALIPAYRPSSILIGLVKALGPGDWQAVVVVDDGSGAEYRAVFDEVAQLPKVQVVRHAVNLGKGAALKTGINVILCNHPHASGVITVDADGQHDPDDVRQLWERFQESPDTLVLGVRSFRRDVPLRSWMGNEITRRVMRAVVGQNLSDTQTGLRVIPRVLLARLLKVPASGYEFELEMLLAAKHLGLKVIQQPIRTIYQAGNRSSHFHPLRDSMRIYFVLLRFAFIGALTAVLDNLTFYLVYRATGRVLLAQIAARLVGVLFNYSTARRAVFLSEERHGVLLPRYLLVVAAHTSLSYAGIRLLSEAFSVPVLPAKIAAEALLFFASFAVQRDFVFTKRAPSNAPTDWDRYYRSVPCTARLTRRYTESVLISVLRRLGHAKGTRAVFVEIGGANSCFLDGLLRAFQPRAYHIIDRNEYGLSLLRERLNGCPDVFLHRGDVLRLEDSGLHAGMLRADVVFSVGLIEHFDTAATRQAIRAHFDLLHSGGHAIISFPTPTWLYVGARSVAEALGLWHFTDERPLEPAEVRKAVRDCGELVFEKTLWPLVFTQQLMVVRKAHHS